MRKRIIDQGSKEALSVDQGCLDLEHMAQVEITSEDPAYPIESALTTGAGAGWRAAQAGEQTIRLVFDEPQRLNRILLLFEEDAESRTHEFVIRVSTDGGRSYREVLRQQFTFSPPSTIREMEDYAVKLDGVTALELRIVPDISGGGAHASLTRLRLA